MKVKDIILAIEEIAPIALQESWDNSGLQVGDSNNEIKSAVIALDITEAVVDDAVAHGDGLIISHHPMIFGGLKQITGSNDVERAVIKAIKNDVAIYSAHTSIDVVKNGVSWRMAEKLGLQNVTTLMPQKGILKKLITFVPSDRADQVRQAIFEAGAGDIGNYDSCSHSVEGKGTFRGKANANPYVGVKGELHIENETRVETIFPSFLQGKVLAALLKAHPYEEVAYDIYALDNTYEQVGLGVVGDLPNALESKVFLKSVKDAFECDAIRFTQIVKSDVKRIALVGGSGSDFINAAIGVGADVFISGDFKYHQFFEAEGKILIADIGHYESEQFTKELFYEIVTNKFSKFALRLSKVKTNPVNYLY